MMERFFRDERREEELLRSIIHCPFPFLFHLQFISETLPCEPCKLQKYTKMKINERKRKGLRDM